jgi:hypothetical protein
MLLNAILLKAGNCHGSLWIHIFLFWQLFNGSVSIHTWLFIVKSQEIGDKCEGTAKQNIQSGNKKSKEIIIKTDNPFPIENVKILDKLSDRYLCQHQDKGCPSNIHLRPML